MMAPQAGPGTGAVPPTPYPDPRLIRCPRCRAPVGYECQEQRDDGLHDAPPCKARTDALAALLPPDYAPEEESPYGEDQMAPPDVYADDSDLYLPEDLYDEETTRV